MPKTVPNQLSIPVRQQMVVDRLREIILTGERVGGDRLAKPRLCGTHVHPILHQGCLCGA
jgi:hypothetical protein